MEVMGLQEGNSPAGALPRQQPSSNLIESTARIMMNKFHKSEIFWMGSLKLSME